MLSCPYNWVPLHAWLVELAPAVGHDNMLFGNFIEKRTQDMCSIDFRSDVFLSMISMKPIIV